MWRQKILRVVISRWVTALVVSVVPVGGMVSGDPVGGPDPIAEQTNPSTTGCSFCSP